MKRLRVLAFAAVIMLSTPACTTTGAGAGVRWYNPATWVSGSEGRAAARADAALGDAREEAVGAAKQSAHETQAALSNAPKSPQVDAAKASNDNTVALLDQVDGPQSAKEAVATREKVALLTSDKTEERAKGAVIAAADQKHIDKISAKLDKLADAKDAKDKALSKAFERENGLANELRNERWWSWFWRITLGALAVTGVAGFIYLRLTLGGLPTALSKSLGELRSADPSSASAFTRLLDVHTTPAEQSLIRLLSAKHNTPST